MSKKHEVKFSTTKEEVIKTYEEERLKIMSLINEFKQLDVKQDIKYFETFVNQKINELLIKSLDKYKAKGELRK